MLNNTLAVGSPEWWLVRLGQGLTNSYTDLRNMERYASGDHPLPFGAQKMREAYLNAQKMARSNYCGLVVNAVCERLSVKGFYSGGLNPVTDSGAWQIWQANSLDTESDSAHRLAASLGRSYVIVGPPDPTDSELPDTPVITVENPFQVIHECDPCRPRRLLAALKTYFDSIRNVQLAVVYLPQAIYYFQSSASGSSKVTWEANAWQPDDSEFPSGVAPNSLGVVPVVPFINRRSMNPLGLSEFGDVTDVQDRINTSVLDRLVTQKMQAFRQRWVTGMDTEDENGNPLRPFDPGVDLIWTAPNPTDGSDGVKFGDFEQSDLGPMLDAIQSDIGVLGNLTCTPPFYLSGALVNVSGDALAVAESALVGKIRNRQLEYGESWEQVIRLAGRYGSVPVAQDAAIQWADPERYSLASKAEAMVMLQTAGVPFRERMAVYGYSPTEIDRMEAERTADALLQSFTSPQSVAPGVSGVTVAETGIIPGNQPPDDGSATGQPASA